MQTISEVFNTDNYIPFVLFCQGQRLTKMADLQYLSFEKLSQVPGLTPALIMRIKSVYTLYRKNHPEEFIGVKPKAAVSTAASNQEIIDQVIVSGNEEQVFADCVRTWKKNLLAQEEQRLILQLSLADEENNQKRIEELTDQLMDIQKKMKIEL